MKKILQVYIFFSLITQLVFPQWTNQNPVPDGNDLWSTFFIDHIGWIVGADGFIKKTTNAGLDWVLQESNTTLTLKSVQFVDQYSGWICGEAGLILKTTDGGANWVTLTSGTTQHLSDLHFYDADTGYVVGFGGTILKTTNGGLVWTNLSSGTTNDLSSLDFVDAFIGYAVGGIEPSYSILKTTDGGLNWIEKPVPLLANLRSLNTVEFVDANTGWIGGDEGACCRGSICKTTDGGESWTCQDLSSLRKTESIHNENLTTEIGGIRSIFFKDTNNGYAVGGYFGDYGDNREIFRTTDGGLTWIEKIYESWHSGLLSVYINSIGKGWAVGYAGVIFITEDDGNSWAQTLSGKGSVACASADIYSLFFINENIGWAGGYRGWCYPDPGNIILKTTNGGKIWRRQYFDLQAGPTILSLYFINEYIGWAIAEENGFACTSGLYRTTDGGDNWICSEGILGSSIFFINQDTGWVASQNGIHKSSDSGETWIQKSSISSSSVYFSDNNNGWATGWSGILKSTDGGETWVSKAAEDMNYVKFFNSNVGMCVGNTGIVLLSTDGGENWISKSSGTTNDLKSIELTNPTTAWVVGSNGTILHTTDLGDNWTTYDGVSANDLTSISFANENTGWVAGLYGAMFKYAVEPPSPPVWSNQIIVEDSSGTEDSQILTFGQHTDATDSIDSSLGEYELPPVPPTEIFDTRFNLPTSFPISSLTDFRDSSDTEIEWNVSFQPSSSGYPMTFSWDSTAFFEGSFYLKDLIDGSFVLVNMKNQSSYTLDSILISSLNIIYYEDGTVPSAPTPPTNLSGIADTSTVELYWLDNSDNETGFIIERKDGDSLSVNSFAIIDTVAANDTFYTDIGLIPDTTYTYRVSAFNEFGSSNYSNVFQITTLPLQVTFQLTVSVLDGWNMVSIPGLHPINQEVTTWWSGMDPSTNVFEYNVSYQVVTTASSGKGYWMKNLGEQTYSTGDEWPVSGIIAVDYSPIGCVEGWNMIGGYEYNAAVSSITTTPSGLQESPFYGFSGVYQTSDFLIPGYGYWVKLSADGLLNLPQVNNKSDELKEWFPEDWGKIILTDASGINYTLYAVTGQVDLDKYELPPMPPSGMFDIRYGSGRIAEDINNSIQEIQMSGVTYPLTVRAEGMDMRLMDETGKTVNVNLKSGEDVVIGDATIQKLMVTGELIPAVYALEQNYPNPFNPNTTIKFAIAQDSNVKLIIYDILGEEVLRLIDKEMKAGYHQIELNASQFSSGVYLYTITAGDFVETKKMVLIK